MRQFAFESLYGSNPPVTVSLFTESGPGEDEAIKLNIFPPHPDQDPFRTIVIDPGQGGAEHFSDLDVVALRGQGFAIAYTETVTTGAGETVATVVASFDHNGVQLGVLRLPGVTGLGDAGAHPRLTALADGGFALDARQAGSGQNTGFFFDDHTVRTGAADFAHAPDLLDTGHGIIALMRLPEGDIVEVVGKDGSVLQAATTVTVVAANSLDGRVLTGGPGPDDLEGSVGADTLVASGGVDILNGDRGLDLIIFRLDGSVDVSLGFGRLDINDKLDPPSGGDQLRIETAAGANAATPASILSYDNQSGIISFDPDGGQGPSPFIPVAVIAPGRGQISAAELAPGFEPGIVRHVNTDGSHSDVKFTYGREDFTQASADYNPAGQLVAYVVDFRDGHQTLSRFDAANQQPWERSGAEFDAQGRLTFFGVLNDDGSHTNSTFDPGNTQPYSRIGEEYDPQGRLAVRGVRLDDGSLRVDRFDVSDQHPYGYSVENYDAAGVLVSVRFFNDDGSPFLG